MAGLTTLYLRVLLDNLLTSISGYRGDEFPSRDCPECNEELCPKPGAECPQGLVPDICGCCPQGVCGLSEGKKCFNASLSRVLPAESRKYGVCGGNLHCLLRPDLKSRVSDLHSKRAVVRCLSVGGPRIVACHSARFLSTCWFAFGWRRV